MTTEVETLAADAHASSARVARQHGVLGRLLRRPGAALCLAWIAAVVVLSIIFRVFNIGQPLQQNLSNSLSLPSTENLLGTDLLGRDVFSRLLYGGWETILGALIAVAIAIVLGTTLGLVAGFAGGVVDAVINWLQDILITLPTILVLLAVATVMGNNIWAAMIVLGVLMSAAFIRLVRASTHAAKEELYVDAARVAGLSDSRILARHILPNVIAPVVIQGSAALGTALVVQAGLGFLGLGAPPPIPNWGGMISEASQAMNIQPWLLLPSGFMIILTVLALNLLGDYLRDELYAARSSSPEAAGGPARKLRTAAAPTSRTDRSEHDPEALASVRDLKVSFPRDGGLVDVVSGVSFSIARGDVVALVGESGCGKTMTALALIGLVPRPGVVTGDLVIAGREMSGSPKSFSGLRGKKIALISQEPMVALDPAFTVGNLLCEALRGHGVQRSRTRGRAAELLAMVGIPRVETVLNSYPHQLSGGMAQRVAIALALSGDPDLLIADEPTTALDVTVQAEILDLLRDLQQRTGMGLLLITHDLGVVADICTRAIVMYAGQVVEEADIDALFDNPQHPYSAALMASTPVLDSTAELQGIPGMVPPPAQWPSACRFAPRCSFATDACRSEPILLRPMAAEHTARCIRAEELDLRSMTPTEVNA